MSNENLLKIHPAIYPFLCSEIKTTSIPLGQYSLSADDIFLGLVPCQLIIGPVASLPTWETMGEILSTFEIIIVVWWASRMMDNHIPLSLCDPITKPISMWTDTEP